MQRLIIGSHSSSFSAAVTCKRSSLVRGPAQDPHTINALFEMDAHGCRLLAGPEFVVTLCTSLVFTTAVLSRRGCETWGRYDGEMQLLPGMQPTFVAGSSEPSVSWSVAFPV